MLEHYHMSFLLTTENGNFLLYPIMFKNQILYKADGLIQDLVMRTDSCSQLFVSGLLERRDCLFI